MFQLARRHKGINKVVKKIKNKDIPSIPKTIFKFRLGTQKNFTTN